MTSSAQKKFEAAQRRFHEGEDVAVGKQTVAKIGAIINEIGKYFETMTGGDISDKQTKIAGYKFYFADNIADMLLKSKFLKNHIENYKAKEWIRVKNEIEEERSKVKNKEEIENVLIEETWEDAEAQLFYDAQYVRLNAKAIAASEVLTALVQRKAELSKQIDQSKLT